MDKHCVFTILRRRTHENISWWYPSRFVWSTSANLSPWQMHHLGNTLNLPEYPQFKGKMYGIRTLLICFELSSNIYLTVTYGIHTVTIANQYWEILITYNTWALTLLGRPAELKARQDQHASCWITWCHFDCQRQRTSFHVVCLWLVIAISCYIDSLHIDRPFHPSPTPCWFSITKLTDRACNSNSNPDNPWLFHQSTAPIGSHQFTSTTPTMHHAVHISSSFGMAIALAISGWAELSQPCGMAATKKISLEPWCVQLCICLLHVANPCS